MRLTAKTYAALMAAMQRWGWVCVVRGGRASSMPQALSISPIMSA